MRKTYRYELYHQSNVIMLGNLIDDMHQVHIHFIKLIRRYYRMYKKYPGQGKLNSHLKKLKKTTKPHWWDLPSQALQDVIRRIHLGYVELFKYLKKRKKGIQSRKVGSPKLKPRHKYNSITFTQAGFVLENNRIIIKCLGKSFTFWKDRDWTGIVKTVTIKRDKVGDYYLYLSCEDAEKAEPLPLSGNEVGIDFGLKTLLTLSDGSKIKSPEFFRKELNKVRSANKALSRKKQGSNAWYKALRHLNRVHKRITNRRNDWFFKTALRLVRKYDTIVIETLNLDGMKRLWGRKVSDIAFGTFVQILQFMCDKYGKTLEKIGRWEPTTKVCHKCHHKNNDLTLADREWICDSCGTHHDRDINAAKVILQVGVASA